MDSKSAEAAVRVPESNLQDFIVDGTALAVEGKLIKIVSIRDEIWLEGDLVPNPKEFIEHVKESGRSGDIFSFGQKIPHSKPVHDFYFELDNFAVVPITTYADWWDKRLPQESRRNVRIAGKRGTTIKECEFSDELARGIHGIYNETPYRQGRRFPHFGKSVERVKAENATFLNRSVFIGAYCGNELIGFLKLVFVDNVASIMQILSKNSHLEKKPMNALIAKAVEICERQKCKYLVYRKFTYSKVYSALTEFKRRNGFEAIEYPRYFVPLTWKGRIGLKMGLHRSLRDSLPPKLVTWLAAQRGKYVRHFGKKTLEDSSP